MLSWKESLRYPSDCTIPLVTQLSLEITKTTWDLLHLVTERSSFDSEESPFVTTDSKYKSLSQTDTLLRLRDFAETTTDMNWTNLSELTTPSWMSMTLANLISLVHVVMPHQQLLTHALLTKEHNGLLNISVVPSSQVTEPSPIACPTWTFNNSPTTACLISALLQETPTLSPVI